MRYRVPFGDIQIGDTARRLINEALDRRWISEGRNVAEFERRFAEKFQWKHAIACSSGTDAGIVVWSAIRELRRLEYGQGDVITPACAFTATANCILAVGVEPAFVDVTLDTLNINPELISAAFERCDPIGIQFVATMGKPTPIGQVAAIADAHDLYMIGDFCEAHGAQSLGNRIASDSYCDAAIYSFYAAHMVVAGEGGMICTDDDEIAALCRSIKCHGYGEGPRFNFQRIGFNSKMNDLTAAIGIEGLEKFDETFLRRRDNRAKLLSRLAKYEDRLILYSDDTGEIISPHAFPIVLRDESADVMPLFRHLEAAGIECKTLFGSLPNHKAFKFLGYRQGDFPVAERIGRTGLHFSCSEHLTDDDINYVVEQVGSGLKNKC